MNESPPQRLVWRRSGPNGFIAFPMGENWRDVQATLVSGATKNRGRDAWHWVVRFETWGRAAGMSVYRRLAVEAANVAWPVVRAEGETARSAAMLRQRLLLAIDKVERRNVVTIEDFGLGNLDPSRCSSSSANAAAGGSAGT